MRYFYLLVTLLLSRILLPRGSHSPFPKRGGRVLGAGHVSSEPCREYLTQLTWLRREVNRWYQRYWCKDRHDSGGKSTEIVERWGSP